MEATAEQELSVVMSSHLVADLERVCDYLIVLVASRVQLAGEVDEPACHPPSAHRTAPRGQLPCPAGQQVITESHTDRQSTFAGAQQRADPGPDLLSRPSLDLEDLVLAYMGSAESARGQSGGVTMIWLSWRQFRAQAIVAGAALVAVAIALTVTGPRLAALFNDSGPGNLPGRLRHGCEQLHQRG